MFTGHTCHFDGFVMRRSNKLDQTVGADRPRSDFSIAAGVNSGCVGKLCAQMCSCSQF